MKIISLTIIFVLFFTNTIYATVYYIDSSSGNDTFVGDEVHPWKTIQKATNTLIGGDTVYFKSGTYLPTQKIEFLNSGTEDNYINYFAYPGDEQLVVIDGSNISLPNWYGVFAIISKSNIRISGLKVINSSYAGFFIDLSTNIIIENNYTYQTKSSGISVWDSDIIIIDNNSVSRACWPTGGEQECISIATSNHVLVQNNHVYDGGSIGFGGGGEGIDLKDGCTNSIVYNNTIHDIASVGIYIDAYETDQSNIHVLKNTVYNISGVGIATVSEEGGLLKNVIVSKNYVYNCDERCMVVHWTNKPNYLIQNIYIHHNTFYNNGEGLDIGAHSLGENINITNNIFSQNLVYQIQNSSDDLNSNELKIRNNLLDGVNPSWALFGDNYIIGNPEFIDISTYDFHLEIASPAINGGGFLAKTTNAGTGVIIELEDAGFFTDGYGISKGDLLQFEGQTQEFEILGIDYINNTITLNQVTSWNIGDRISLTYNDPIPDVGAYEYYENTLTNDSSINNNFIVYPNPTKDIVYFSNDLTNKKYKIVSITGTIIKNGIIKGNKILLSDLKTGFYFINIIDLNNTEMNTIKLIKE